MRQSLRRLLLLLLAVLLIMGSLPSAASACIDNDGLEVPCIQSMPPVVTEDF